MGGDKGGPIVIDDDEEGTQEGDEEVQLQLNKQNHKRLRPNGTGEAHKNNTSRPKGLDVGVLRSTSKSLSSYRHTTKRTRTLSPDSSPTHYSGSFFDSDSDSHENYVYVFDGTSERNLQKTVDKGKEEEYFENECPSESDKIDHGSTDTNSTPLSPKSPTSPSGDFWLTTSIKTEGDIIKTIRREESNWKDALDSYVEAVFNRADRILQPRAFQNEIEIMALHLNSINQHECSNEIGHSLQVLLAFSVLLFDTNLGSLGRLEASRADLHAAC